MALFGNRYQKEGKGVSKNETQKRKFFLFFELYFRKFWNLIKLNLIYFGVNLLSFAAVGVMLFSFNVQGRIAFDIVALSALLILVISGVILGPSTAAMTYVLRNYANEKHSFIVSDFFEHFKKNFKQAAPIGVLSIVIPVMFLFAFVFYSQIGGVMGIVLLAALAFCAIVIASAFLYIYPIMITFDLKLKDVIKNSLILAFANAFVNIFIIVVNAVLIWYIIGLSIWVLLVLAVFLLFSTLGFLNVFSVWGAIEKYLMPDVQDDENDETIFSDERIL